MMWSDDPVRDEMRYQYEQEEKEKRSCLHCLLDEDSEMCEDCVDLEGCNYEEL